MKAILGGLATPIWLLLVAATAASWLLGTEQLFGVTAEAVRASGISVLLLAFAKVRLVVRYFMEVRHAPLMLKLILDGWIVIVCGTLLGLYLGT